jgi:hypothetical protein
MDYVKKPDGSYVQLHSMPCVFRLGNLEYTDGHYTYLSEEWQFFTFNLLSLSYYGKTYDKLTRAEYRWLAARWANVYDSGTAFTNNQGSDKNRDYVNNTNEDADKDIGLYSIVSGGASLEGMGVFTNKAGSRMLRVDTFDGTKPPPDISTINWRTDPRIFFATIISDKRVSGGGYSVYRFSQLENPLTHVVHDLPIPIIASKDVYYPMSDLRYVADGVKPSPYWP